jgi:hypothetical protein
MKKALYILTLWMLWTGIACKLRYPLDEVTLPNQSTLTGRIVAANDTALIIRHLDYSKTVLDWSQVSRVQSLNFRSPMLSVGTGLFRTPYYSVFEGQSYIGRSGGLQVRVGQLSWRKRYRYAHFAVLPNQPYALSKVGIGTERYLIGNYMQKHALSGGIELNLMDVERNNAAQLCIEPFVAFTRQTGRQWACYARLGWHQNILATNRALGVNFSVGCNYRLRNFDRRYQRIIANHRL